MQCECCGRETEVLIEIGAISPKVSVTGRCCVDCCAFILTALEDAREDAPELKAEIIPVEETQQFVDGNGSLIEEDEIRFGMKDSQGKIHYFRVYKVWPIPEYEADEIYPAGESRLKAERTAYCFRTFGHQKSDDMLMAELLEKLETALLNPVIEEEKSSVPFLGKQEFLRERGYAEIGRKNEEIGFLVDGRYFGARKFADMFDRYEGFRLCWQIQDALTGVPDRDTYWVPVRLTDERLLDELERLIVSSAGSREFISYKNVNAFDIGFDALMEKLINYAGCNPPGIGKMAGMKLIRRLEELETDDDMFPEYHVAAIREVIGEF